MNSDCLDELIIPLLTGAQRPLYPYILTLLPDPAAADDVLQETSLVLWRKRGEFVPGSNFFAWACRIAQFQVLAWLRDHKRNRNRMECDGELIQQLAVEAAAEVPEQIERAQALRECIAKLCERDRGLLQRRYAHGVSVTKLAEDLGKTVNAVSRSLYRIRGLLLQCMDRAAVT